MSILERAKSHFESIGVQSIEVPEWKDEDGKPSVFYSNPLTLEEKNIIFKKSNNFSDLSVLVDIIVMKLLVKDEKENLVKAFKLEDKFELRKSADPNVLSEISNQILKDTRFEDAEKK